MRVPFNRVTSAVDSARSTLTALADALGADGLAAAARCPGLLATVDQHAAAVRDSLEADDRPLTPAALAGYVEGVSAAARDHGWTPPPGPVDWSDPDWLLTRLLAVHALAQDLDGAGHPADAA